MIHESFIHNRRQRIILNGQSSNWKFVKAGVPQDSVLRPLFFLIFTSLIYRKDYYLMLSFLLMMLPYFRLLIVGKLLQQYLIVIY